MSLANDTMAPDFDLPNQFGEHVTLREFRGVKPVALVFFPLAFSSTCTTELCTLRDNLNLFKTESTELIGISVDSKATLRAFADAEGYDFTLLADFWPHGEVSKEYGVFLEGKGFANRATFLIDIDGVIRSQFTTAPGQARSLAEYTEALEALHAIRA